MAGNDANQRRAFADAVTIDAWHDPFGTTPKVSLFADVSFGEARVGGEVGSKVRFKLSLRRAEVIVVIPETEPVEVDKASVAREAPVQPPAKLTKTLERSTKGKAKAAGSVGISTVVPVPNATADLSGEAEVAAAMTSKLESEELVLSMLVTQSQTEDGFYRWSIISAAGEPLKGKPWDANDKPRLKLKDLRRNIKKGIAPTVRVEVRCRREDLEISEIVLTDETTAEKVKNRLGGNARLVAAEAYIRNKLAQEGLSAENIHDPFGFLVLGSISASESGGDDP